MKKFMLCIMGSLIALFVVFWCCISYTVNYKKITCDTSVSPDKKYEVILQAVGEPEWPFGSASGRLVLKEGEDKISQTDFELHNDGASISSSCWKVTWHEDYVEIILSGEEQFDEQVILYFDGIDTSNNIILLNNCGPDNKCFIGPKYKSKLMEVFNYENYSNNVECNNYSK